MIRHLSCCVHLHNIVANNTFYITVHYLPEPHNLVNLIFIYILWRKKKAELRGAEMIFFKRYAQ